MVKKANIDFGGSTVPVLNFKVGKDLKSFVDPFLDFGESAIVYVESEYNPGLNSFFGGNIEKVQELFSRKKLEFIYVPQLASTWNENIGAFREGFKYEYPSFAGRMPDTVPDITTAQLTKLLLGNTEVIKHGGFGQDLQYSGLLRFMGPGKVIGEDQFSLLLLDDLPVNKLWDCLTYYTGGLFKVLNKRQDKEQGYDVDLSPLSFDDIRPDDDFADSSFNQEGYRITKEIEDRIAILKQRGYKGVLLKIIADTLNNEEKEQLNTSASKIATELSPLVIEKDFRLFLPGFNGLEVKMTPLPKAVFLLFLRHPEGILFKHLPDYKAELLAIYQKIAYKESPSEVRLSIGDLTNPHSNSINEKCSRIKECFIKLFDDSIAQNYYVTGKRAEPKRIIIASSVNLISWKADFSDI